MGGHLVAVPVLVSASGGAADAVAGNVEVPTRAGLAKFTDLAVPPPPHHPPPSY